MRSARLITGLLIGAVSVLFIGGSAHADACPGGTGVTIVVNDDIRCDADGARTAADSLTDVGYELTFASQQPGFLCRVDGEPADAPCVAASPADAYWAFFVSDGTSGTWTYASSGITSQRTPVGSWIGLRFQTSQVTTEPEIAPITGSVAHDRTNEGPLAGIESGQRSPIPMVAVAIALAVVLVAAVVLAMRRRRA